MAREYPGPTVAGQEIEDRSAPGFDVIDPSTEELLSSIAVCSPATVDAAVAAAESAFVEWSATTPAERDELLGAMADALMASAAEFAEVESRNTGKPLGVATDEVAACAGQLRYFGGAARTLEGKAASEYMRGRTSFIRRDPVGVVAQITPWNFPLQMAIWKIGPALAAGNTVVLKPSELTPLTTLMLGALGREILPAGVLNVVPGDADTGRALVEHPRVRMACLTGDVSTGREVARGAAGNLKRVHLELGGKAPVIVFDDADLGLLAETVATAGYWNSGQDCTAACRVLVSANRYDDLLAELVPRVRNIRVGGPFDEDGAGEPDMGPVISERQRGRVMEFIEGADGAGAELLCGGGTQRERGWFVEPTLIAGVQQDDEIVRREVFGPVVTVQRFADEEQALEWANGVEYGLSASVWSENIGRCLRMARRLQFGCVWLNEHLVVPDEMPHGGYKQSGYGKDLSPYSIEDYTVVKHVMARIDR